MSEHFPDIEPIEQQHRTPGSSKPPPHRRSEQTAQADEIMPAGLSSHSSVGADDELSYRANGVQTRVITQLRRGQLQIDGKLDLHGLTRAQAARQLEEFITHSRRAGKKCVLVIHGQGYRSAMKVPVLKQFVDQWLRQQPQVLAFHSAQAADGGRGALYVLLRRPERETVLDDGL